MTRVLITSGPTRQYLDPVRYISNASSGRMGSALAAAALAKGWEVVLVSGPVDIPYPPGAEVIPVISTEEMLEEALRVFKTCDGAIGVAAPCDYRPVRVAKHKLSKTGGSLKLHLIETPDIMAALGRNKGERWMVGFALETSDVHLRAFQKLERKSLDMIVANGPSAIHSDDTSIDMLTPDGQVVASCEGTKTNVALRIVEEVAQRFVTIL
jgi:phosphopantothenoylcysteine decarboxylase / phosphopantothenate---cysteine ligase